MICIDHIKYLKDTLESDNGYSYEELYEWNDRFCKAKQQQDNCEEKHFPWKDRYGALKQTTAFFKNIAKIADLIYDSNSIEEFLIICDLSNISREAVNFAVCYIYMCPNRWFLHDWGAAVILSSKNEAKSRHIIESLFEEIDKQHLPMLEVDDFIALKLY